MRLMVRAKATAGAALALALSVTLSSAQPAESGVRSGRSAASAHATCLGCHGIAGYRTAYPDVYHVPLIAGQQPTYIANALKAYASGERSHPSMRGIAAGLSEEIARTLAQKYGAAIPAREAAVRLPKADRNASKAGATKAAQLCAACHGAEGDRPSDPAMPILAGQHYDYLERAIKDYKIGRRTNPVMRGFAAQLSKQEVEELAAWFASRQSNLHVLPQ